MRVQDAVIVGVLTIAYLLLTWLILTGRTGSPPADTGQRSGSPKSGETIQLGDTPLKQVYWYGVVSDSDTPQMMTATLEMIGDDCLTSVPTLAERCNSDDCNADTPTVDIPPARQLVSPEPRHAPSSLSLYERWSDTPIFAALARELGFDALFGFNQTGVAA